LTTCQRADSDIESQKSNCKLNHNPAFENLSMIFSPKKIEAHSPPITYLTVLKKKRP
jgi:hypothetical protein